MTTQQNNKSKKSVSFEDIEAVEQNLFDGEIPAYLKIVNKDTLKVKTGGWANYNGRLITEGDSVWLAVNVKDVIFYYYRDARNISSGIRTLAGYSGDWRGVDGLAKMCLEVFKIINRSGLEKEGKKFEMELK